MYRLLRQRKPLCLLLALVLVCVSLALPAQAIVYDAFDPARAAAVPISLTDLELPVSVQCLAATVHYNPYSSSMPVGLMENGRKLEVLSQTQDYYRVDCFGCDGYIAKELVGLNDEGECYVNLSKDHPDVVSMETYAAAFLEDVQERILDLTYAQIGSRYCMGGQTPGIFDCSGLVYYIFGQTTDLPLARTATPQCGQGIIVDPRQAQAGDLVFFYGTDGTYDFLTHVGICIGDGRFIHASSSRGVVEDSLDNPYWAPCSGGIRRLLLPAGALQTADFLQKAE